MYLVDDIDLVLAESRGHGDLLGELADVLHRVVGGCVELEDVEGASFVEGTAALTLIASLALGG